MKNNNYKRIHHSRFTASFKKYIGDWLSLFILKNIFFMSYSSVEFTVYEWKYSDLLPTAYYWLRLVWDLVFFVGNNNSGLYFIFTYFYPIRVVKWKCRTMYKNADTNYVIFIVKRFSTDKDYGYAGHTYRNKILHL